MSAFDPMDILSVIVLVYPIDKQRLVTFLLENEKDIPEEIRFFDKIGIASGASTPDEVIEEIEKALKKIKKS